MTDAIDLFSLHLQPTQAPLFSARDCGGALPYQPPPFAIAPLVEGTLVELEVRRRASSVALDPSCSIVTPEGAAAVARQILEGRIQESLVVIYLDSRNRVIGWSEVARGESNVVHVSPKELLRTALLAGAQSFIMAHNHPSGDPTPSAEDIHLTIRIREAAETVGLSLLDHVVVTDRGGYRSCELGVRLAAASTSKRRK